MNGKLSMMIEGREMKNTKIAKEKTFIAALGLMLLPVGALTLNAKPFSPPTAGGEVEPGSVRDAPGPPGKSEIIASNDNDGKAYFLDEFVVTGTKLERNLFDTQESIALIPDVVIEERGLTDLQEILSQSANVHTIGGEAFGMRGIAHNSVTTNGGTGESGSYYVDNVAFTGFSKRFGPDDLWDVQQVEILRGPQSTNVGRNALAGAVVVKTNDPIFENVANTRIRYEEFDTYTFSAMGNARLSDNAAVRISANYNETDGFIENPTRGEDDYDARNNQTYRGKFLWTSPDNRFSALLTAQYGETERGEDTIVLQYRDESGNIIRLDPEDRINLSNLDAFETNESWMSSAELRYEINNRWDVRSVTSFLTADYQRFDDDDQLAGGGDAARSRDAVDENFAQEIRFTYDARESLRGTVGVYYTDVTLDDETGFLSNISLSQLGLPASVAPLIPLYPEQIEVIRDGTTENDTTNFAFFTEWEYDFDEQITVFAGFRYDYEKLDSTSESALTSPTQLPNPADFTGATAAGISGLNAFLQSQLDTTPRRTVRTDYDAFLPQIGATYRWTDDFSTSLLYKRGYRAGGSELNTLGNRTEYDPEYLDNFEMALRSRWFEGRLNANLNIFYALWEDQQVGVQVGTNPNNILTENAGESTLYGFELEFDGELSPELNWFFNVGYTHTEFEEFNSAAGDFSGNEFGYAPPWTGAVGATWNFVENWFLHGNVTYTDRSFAGPENDFALDSHVLTNVRLTYQKDRLRVSAFVNNLFDEVYLINKNEGLIDDTLIGKVGAPRVLGVEAMLTF